MIDGLLSCQCRFAYVCAEAGECTHAHVIHIYLHTHARARAYMHHCRKMHSAQSTKRFKEYGQTLQKQNVFSGCDQTCIEKDSQFLFKEFITTYKNVAGHFFYFLQDATNLLRSELQQRTHEEQVKYFQSWTQTMTFDYINYVSKIWRYVSE